MPRIVNEKSYGVGAVEGKKWGMSLKKMTVEFVTDPVPGAWHRSEDLMRWIASHSYVVAVEMEEEE